VRYNGFWAAASRAAIMGSAAGQSGQDSLIARTDTLPPIYGQGTEANLDKNGYSKEVGGATFVSLVTMELKSEKLSYYLDRLKEVAELSAQEPGLLRCEVYIESSNPNKIVILDTFSDREAYELHLSKEYLSIFQKQVADCMENAAVQKILSLVGREKNLIDPVP
jgi:quinol monooxygenase YgiN